MADKKNFYMPMPGAGVAKDWANYGNQTPGGRWVNDYLTAQNGPAKAPLAPPPVTTTLSTAPSGPSSSDLFASPVYQQALAASRAAGTADLAGTRSGIQQLLIDFGLVPQGFQDKLGVLDDTIRSLINKNTESGISQWARLLDVAKDEQRQTVQNTTAAGQRRSGAYGWRLRRGKLADERRRADSLSGLLGTLNSSVSGLASRDYGRQMNLASVLAGLASSWNPVGGSGGGSLGSGYSGPSWSQANPGVAAPWDAGSLLRPGVDYGTLI